ncbi:hypothetical protein LTSEMON_0618 [Salmonella enterica subsp. enterica serovar Montevideo str. S5-403]|uniref:Uncharacterized protein n=1 Tax=Salmonella enterica subsp. enterica serovar Montevideo str. S5-403 TaxID=913242 RepID=G5PYW5_SALMO|nr:hypothetical protein LTSEMON_0618 [Salmonella enterica subsp. enterica serovar Montevideo str. S5-403]
MPRAIMRQIYDRFMKKKGGIDSMLMIYDTGETVHYRVPAVNCAQKWRG